MPQVQLFGELFLVDQIARSYSIDGANLQLQLDPTSTSLRIQLDGSCATLRFTALVLSFACTVSGGRLNIDPGDARWTGTVELVFGGAVTPAGLTRVLAPAPDPEFGLAFDIRQADVFRTAMARGTKGDLTEFVPQWTLAWTSSLVSLDASVKLVELWPRGPDSGMTVADRFGNPHDPRVRQDYSIERLRLGFDRFQVMFWPKAGAIFLNPDVLDPARRLDADANGLLYQHVVSEAYLTVAFSFTTGRWRNTGWSVTPAERDGAIRLAAPVLKDEHGHPVIFSVSEALPIGARRGHAKPVNDPQGTTNQALLIGDPLSTRTFRARMETLDPVAIYGAPRRPTNLVNERLQTPYWVNNRKVALQQRRPREIMGFASDAVLTFDAPVVVKAELRPRPPQDVSLTFTPVRDDQRGLRFVFPTVDVPLDTGHSPTTLSVELPEQSTLVRQPAGAPVLEVVRRTAQAKAGQLTLPLLDSRWAFSNLRSTAEAGDSLAEQGAIWLNRLDQGVRTAFDGPAPQTYEHVEGLRATPNILPMRRILAPASASSTDSSGAVDVRRIGLSPTVFAAEKLRSPANALTTRAPRTPLGLAGFMFGGPPTGAVVGDDPLENARKALADGRSALGDHLEDFFWFWVGLPRGALPPEPEWREARLALWDYLVGLRPRLPDPDNWSFDDLVTASERLQAARDALTWNPPAALGLDGYEEVLQDALPDELAELLDPDRGVGELPRLFQFAYAPPTMELANRALAAAGAETLKRYENTLRTFLTADLQKAIDDYFRGSAGPKGLFAELVQGLPPFFELAQEIWANRDQLAGEARETLLDLAERYGAELTHELYAELLKDDADSEALLGVLRDFGFPLKRLADLAGEPPDYLIVSRRLRRTTSGDPNSDPSRLHPVDQIAALWNHRFDFCVFGGGKAWDLFLDDQTTLFVKLGGARNLVLVLEEAVAAYQTSDRRDPFGLDPAGGSDPVAAFAALLPDELKMADWRGVLVINPKIDLERDPILRTLCGFSHISGRFAAVGGRAPDGLPVELDVWGRIERIAEATGWTTSDGKPTPAAPGWGGADVAWSLIRFSATVKGTTILAGDISFKLDVRELFGRRYDWEPITVAGTLPPTTGSVTGKPRDFTFAATFDRPMPLDVEVAFLDELTLRGIRVGSHDGDTTLDIDADLICRDWSLGPIKLEAPKSINLSDFRIRIPEVEAGRAIAMGALRSLSFDLRGIRFPLAEPRRITVSGLDIRPVGVGLLRGDQNDIVTSLRGETVPLVEPTFALGPATARHAYPYLDTRIEFGRTPALGGAGEFSLVARVGVPVLASDDPITLPAFGSPGVGLATLAGRDLKISLFRLITLEFESIEAGVFNLKGGRKAGVIWADGFNLSFLSWPLFKKGDKPEERSARTLVYAHDTGSNGARGFMAWYAAPSDQGESFFRLQWLLISQNIDPGSTLKNALLSLSGADLKKEKDAIKALKRPGSLQVDLDETFGWLFGIRFELGEFFKPCALILHDGFYYGIRLGGPIAKLLTGEEDISLAYIPGEEPSLDRFRAVLRIAALDMVGVMESGEIALEWNPAWDFLIDLGHPWRGPNGYMWERAFSIPMGIWEAKFGFFIEKRTSLQPPANLPTEPGVKYITLSAGAGFYFGYRFATPRGIAWVSAGIGVFGVLIGSATLKAPENIGNNPLALLKTSLAKLSVTGVLGIYAYGEGGVDIWILSARFRVSAQAFVEVTLVYIPNVRGYLSYNATLAAAYSASVRVGSGMFSWTFSVSGAVQMQISGSATFG
ncbi:hypothetical protein [Mesorhizobium sp.]|uniref:hypothetical protein n=1 Tax=Mesorhizobium sp. TaxID=1871066 RepID=UPI000FE5F345|nr:hypothetical protein [Mesorhizobium sp.]RWP54342.1 MAG: hypothetical protein EOR06_10765 [Mesorhizobium sp.]